MWRTPTVKTLWEDWIEDVVVNVENANREDVV